MITRQNPEKNTNTSAVSSTARALKLRALDATRVALADMIGGGRTAWISIEDAPVEVQLSIDTDMPLGELSTRYFDTRHGLISIAPGDVLIRLLTGIDLPDVASQDSELSRWIATIAIAELASDWQALFGMRGAQPAAGAADMVSLTLRLLPTAGGWSFAGRLRCSLGTLRAMLAAPGWQAVLPATASNFEHLPISRPVLIGTTSIRLDELRGLENGDLLLIDHPSFQPDGKGRIAFGPNLWMNADLSTTGTQLQLQFNSWSTVMDDFVMPSPDNEHEPSEHGAAAALDDLAVTLSFEVGTVERSVAELRQLTAGDVIRLSSPLPPTVVVRSRQTEIARGELVDVDGRLAVRITVVGRRHDAY